MFAFLDTITRAQWRLLGLAVVFLLLWSARGSLHGIAEVTALELSRLAELCGLR